MLPGHARPPLKEDCIHAPLSDLGRGLQGQPSPPPQGPLQGCLGLFMQEALDRFGLGKWTTSELEVWGGGSRYSSLNLVVVSLTLSNPRWPAALGLPSEPVREPGPHGTGSP